MATVLTTNIQNGLTRLATAIKVERAKIGDLPSLTTTAKNNLVAALNEIEGKLEAIQTQVASNTNINDSAASSTTTYSSNKIIQVALDAAAQAKNEILNGAGAAYDTLAELQALLEAGASSDSAIMTALANRVRYDQIETRTATEQVNVRTTLNVYSIADIGDVTLDFIPSIEAALV